MVTMYIHTFTSIHTLRHTHLLHPSVYSNTTHMLTLTHTHSLCPYTLIPTPMYVCMRHAFTFPQSPPLTHAHPSIFTCTCTHSLTRRHASTCNLVLTHLQCGETTMDSSLACLVRACLGECSVLSSGLQDWLGTAFSRTDK